MTDQRSMRATLVALAKLSQIALRAAIRLATATVELEAVILRDQLAGWISRQRARPELRN